MSQTSKSRPTTGITIVLFGATGDLASRMLVPSLFSLWLSDPSANLVSIIGTGRSVISSDDFRNSVSAILKAEQKKVPSHEALSGFLDIIQYLHTSTDHQETFDALGETLRATGSEEVIFYLATPPASYGPICESLSRSKLNSSRSRIAIEKPVGHDFSSCEAINNAVGACFSESRIFRIDHYLGKEAVQNLLALRFGSMFSDSLWNKDFIDNIQISITETVGVEERFSYYDQYGALRDMVQNHILQLLCLVAMDLPEMLDANSIRHEKLEVMKKLLPVKKENIALGQYGDSETVKTVKSYSNDIGDKASNTETYVAIKAELDCDRWRGVPFYLRTGKRLPERLAEIVVCFKPVRHPLFGDPKKLPTNKLIIRLQPGESIKLRLTIQEPGSSPEKYTLKAADLVLDPGQKFGGVPGKSAYERILHSLLRNDATLFVKREEVELAWQWIDIITSLIGNENIRPEIYPAGSHGPASADKLLSKNGHKWHE